jgi:hypothetical protein
LAPEANLSGHGRAQNHPWHRSSEQIPEIRLVALTERRKGCAPTYETAAGHEKAAQIAERPAEIAIGSGGQRFVFRGRKHLACGGACKRFLKASASEPLGTKILARHFLFQGSSAPAG